MFKTGTQLAELFDTAARGPVRAQQNPNLQKPVTFGLHILHTNIVLFICSGCSTRSLPSPKPSAPRHVFMLGSQRARLSESLFFLASSPPAVLPSRHPPLLASSPPGVLPSRRTRPCGLLIHLQENNNARVMRPSDTSLPLEVPYAQPDRDDGFAHSSCDSNELNRAPDGKSTRDAANQRRKRDSRQRPNGESFSGRRFAAIRGKTRSEARFSSPAAPSIKLRVPICSYSRRFGF